MATQIEMLPNMGCNEYQVKVGHGIYKCMKEQEYQQHIAYVNSNNEVGGIVLMFLLIILVILIVIGIYKS